MATGISSENSGNSSNLQQQQLLSVANATNVDMDVDVVAAWTPRGNYAQIALCTLMWPVLLQLLLLVLLLLLLMAVVAFIANVACNNFKYCENLREKPKGG